MITDKLKNFISLRNDIINYLYSHNIYISTNQLMDLKYEELYNLIFSNNKEYKLFLDDIKEPKDVKSYIRPGISNLYDNDWTIAKTYDDFCKIIMSKGLPTLISFDHDLNLEHQREMIRCQNEDDEYSYDNFKEKTGYDCAKWLVEYCLTNNFYLPTYVVHSTNRYGSINIKLFLQNAKQHDKI